MKAFYSFVRKALFILICFNSSFFSWRGAPSYAQDIQFLKKEPLPLPLDMAAQTTDKALVIETDEGEVYETTIDPELQFALQTFIKKRTNPISSVVVVEAKTGKILAMAQGRSPRTWGSSMHTALYGGFPAASLFKVIPTAAALELIGADPQKKYPVNVSCAQVKPTGRWIYNFTPSQGRGMNLTKAFALSCNSFFSKFAIQYVGMGPMELFARKLGWGESIPADFEVPISPALFPASNASDMEEVGKFAAGFGRVGISPMHAAWLNLIIANDGKVVPLQILKDTVPESSSPETILEEETAHQIRKIMNKTVVYGTASSAFRTRRYWHLVKKVGGKTGTLSSKEFKGQTTWFAGMMPYKDPEIVVSSVVILDGERWYVRGTDLAAEAFHRWSVLKKKRAEKKELVQSQK